MYVALTYIPGGGLLTGFAMRSDPNVENTGPSSRLFAAAAPLAGPSRTHYDYRKLSSSSRDVGVFRQIKQPDRREAG